MPSLRMVQRLHGPLAWRTHGVVLVLTKRTRPSAVRERLCAKRHERRVVHACITHACLSVSVTQSNSSKHKSVLALCSMQA